MDQFTLDAINQRLTREKAGMSLAVVCSVCGDQVELGEVDMAGRCRACSTHALAYTQETGEGLKPTNPKDAIGGNKIPFHLWPETATIMGSLGMLDGALKYGRANWRAGGVKASIYFDALRRHVNKLWEGEDIDPDSGLPHECHALACLAILIDAKAAGVLDDDRAYQGGYTRLLNEMTPHVKRLKDLHQGKKPHHWTIHDIRNAKKVEPISK